MILIKIQSVILIFICVIYSSLVFSQKGIISGKIIDYHTKEPLIGAVARIENSSLGAVTDIEGDFLISEVKEGQYSLSFSYFSYKTKTIFDVVVKSEDTTFIEVTLEVEITTIEEIEIVAKLNRESENVLLLDQKKSLITTQSIGAAELSRKGFGDAEAAVSSVAGISKQEGVKNVFIRGLGDRYNQTLLNNLPIPSEDPEYKNIALSIFEADIIKNIGIEKVFSSQNYADVGGAVINIKSKELQDDYALGINVSTGFNSKAVTSSYKRVDGIGYFGNTNKKQPIENKYSFSNSLDPNSLNVPINESYRISGGKLFNFRKSSLSIFAVGSHASEYTFTEESIRNSTTDGTIYQEQTGQKYSGKKSQLALANINYKMNNSHSISYNFILLHTTNYYIGEYIGRNSEKFQDAFNDMGYVRRQQINDNLLFSHQFITEWKFSEKWFINIDAAINQIKGNEPDRRENYLSKKEDETYRLTGSNRQKRFYSELNENQYNTKFSLSYKLKDKFSSGNSKITFGYSFQNSTNNFEAVEYNFSALTGSLTLNNLLLNNLYNSDNYNNHLFSIQQSDPSTYSVAKNNHSAFGTGSYQITQSLSGIIGFRYDFVHLNVLYDIPGQKGSDSIKPSFYLPSLHLKYDINDKQIIRFGASKTYTLPQSKEISPYQYVNIGFTSEGNPKLTYSNNYNLDLKWEYYLKPEEIISAGVFYKYIENPIGRVDKGNSAGLLTYDNIGKNANVLGFETEIRKTIFQARDIDLLLENRLTSGINFSYILTQTKLHVSNTPERISKLEGASPIIINLDLTYHYTKRNFGITTSIVFNYFSDRIFTIGTLGYQDIIEKGIPTIDYILGCRINKRFGLKIKVANVLNPTFQLSRKAFGSNDRIILNSYKKGINFSLGVSFDL
ncbi:MAG: carboxypeptidase-like regulatory domain-containing protein [Crocinitomicaceae bacterium]|nr:carboxypeptidase-like regulatory domain-containing protein [Crocinitomicaceae bacterium]